jgi:hypothetical protein
MTPSQIRNNALLDHRDPNYDEEIGDLTQEEIDDMETARAEEIMESRERWVN